MNFSIITGISQRKAEQKLLIFGSSEKISQGWTAIHGGGGQCDKSSIFTVENAVNHESPKKKRRQAKKAKIPQKLVENRKQEIIASLDKVADMTQSVVKGIPRVNTGSKRGSSFRGVSVNGKKWQVSLQLPDLSVKITYSNYPTQCLNMLIIGYGHGLRQETLLRRHQR